METWWPWLAIAGLGVLHGVSPANGWMFAAAWGVRARGGVQARYAQVRRALLPIAIGHATSVAIVVCAVAQGILMDGALVQCVAGAALIGAAMYRWLRAPVSARQGIASPADTSARAPAQAPHSHGCS